MLIRNQEERLPISQDEESESEAEVEEPASESLKSAFKIALEDSLLDLSLGGTPLLQKPFGEQITKHQLNALLLEIFSVMGDRNNSIDFWYRNGLKGRAILIPQVKRQGSFMVQAKRLSWIEALLDHVAGGNDECNRDDSAQWLGYYLGKRYDGSFTLTCESLGLPIV